MSAYVKDLGTHNANVSATNVTTLTATPAASNTVVLVAANSINSGTASTLSSVTDSKGNTWVIIVQKVETVVTPHQTVAIAYCLQNVAPLVSGDTVTATWSDASSDLCSMLLEITGQLGPDVNATGQATAGTTTMNHGTTGATAQAAEIAIAALASSAVQASFTPDGAYSLPTLNHQNYSSATRTVCVQYSDLQSVGAQSCGGVLASSATFASVLVTFKVPAGGGITPPPPAGGVFLKWFRRKHIRKR